NHDVRFNIPVLAAEPSGSAPKSTLYLIENQKNAVLVAQLAQALQVAFMFTVAGGRYYVSALAEHRLHDDGCNRIWFHLMVEKLEKQLKAFQLATTRRLAHGTAIAVRVSHRIYSARQRLVAFAIMRLCSGQCRCQQRAPMKGARKRYNVWTA